LYCVINQQNTLYIMRTSFRQSKLFLGCTSVLPVTLKPSFEPLHHQHSSFCNSSSTLISSSNLLSQVFACIGLSHCLSASFLSRSASGGLSGSLHIRKHCDKFLLPHLCRKNGERALKILHVAKNTKEKVVLAGLPDCHTPPTKTSVAPGSPQLTFFFLKPPYGSLQLR
jgi:hypothetical protein